jgi:hypothetical protein
MDKEDRIRKCLLIYDETKLRIDDRKYTDSVKKKLFSWVVDKHQMDVKKDQNITFLVQCLSSKKPFWFILFSEHFDHSTSEILRDQIKYCFDTLKFLGLDLENVVTDMAPHHLTVRIYFPDQNFSFDLLHCLDNVMKLLVKNSLSVNNTTLNLEIIKIFKLNNYQWFKHFF